jgi:putative colanic acid biosynthesis glycosyltransferase WcaI
MKILMLSQWFDPEPTFKGLVFARQLQSAGHEVHVITGFPNYPGGKVYNGYRIRLYQSEIIDGVKVSRVPLYPSHSSSSIGRSLNYMSFMISSMFYGLFFAPRVDVIYVYHPPITACIAAAMIGIVRRVPFVSDVQDLWPDTLRATGMISNKFLLKAIGIFCNWIYRRATHIVVLSQGFKTRLVERGVAAEKVTIIHNWCDEVSLDRQTAPTGPVLPEGFNLVFAGNLGRAQGLEHVVRAASLLGQNDRSVNVVFVGSGLEESKLKQLAIDENVGNIYFIPRVSVSEIGAILKRADALLVHLKGDELFKITIPGKTQTYLYIGRPIIMAVEGDAANMVSKAEAGLTCRSDDASALANCIDVLVKMTDRERQEMGERGRQYYRKHLSLEVGTAKFVDILQQISEK